MSGPPEMATCRCIGCGVSIWLGSTSMAVWARLDGHNDFGLCERCIDRHCRAALEAHLRDHLAQRRPYTPEQEIEVAR